MNARPLTWLLLLVWFALFVPLFFTAYSRVAKPPVVAQFDAHDVVCVRQLHNKVLIASSRYCAACATAGVGSWVYTVVFASGRELDLYEDALKRCKNNL